jgi:phosphatidylglycerophosphatase A
MPLGLVIRNRVVMGLATGGGVGYLPFAPGTFGSLLGLVLYVGLAALPFTAYGAVVAVLGLIGVWASTEAEQLLGQKDASIIVIDEVVGILLALWSVSLDRYIPVVLGFGLFRLFDIIKPWPALERLPQGWGVMMDDVFAGAMAQGVLRVLSWLALMR